MVNAEPRYKRALNGITVHRAECSRAVTAVPWNYADDMDSDAICLTLVQYVWLRPCRVCKPEAATS